MDADKAVWETYPDIWPTKAKFFAWLRGSLRRAVWEKYPPKLTFKNAHCHEPPKGYTGKARSGAFCALSGDFIGKSQLQVDHTIGHVSLKEWEDVLPFVQHLCAAEYGPYENFQLVGKEAHKVKSHAERKGITFQEAILDKKVIAFTKLKPQQQLNTLSQYIVPGEADVSSAEKRKNIYRQILQGGKNVD
jgi:hypothetical protein